MRNVVLLGLSGIFAVAAVNAACSAEPDEGFENDSAGSEGAGAGASTFGDGGFDPGSGSGDGPCTATDPGSDNDLDGYNPPEDCNDCDPNINPGAIEVIVTEPGSDGTVPEPADEDCDGSTDNPPPPCDDGIALEDSEPRNGARAIDICKEAVDSGYGIMSAEYVRANGSPMGANAGIGIFDGFGPSVSVQVGSRMLAIASGTARLPGHPQACVDHACETLGPGSAPPGFPQNAAGCTAPEDSIQDDVGFQVQLRAPTNAIGYKFLFKFYTFEHAEWVCTPFNDQFMALVDPPPMGAMDGNISFDNGGNPVSVNVAFFDVCDPGKTDWAAECPYYGGSCPPQPSPYCPSGTAELMGNGFLDAFGSGMEDGGATSWLQTTAPVQGGDVFTIRFAVWDTSDQWYDSTTLIDGFAWVAAGGSVDVETGEIPDPK